MKSTHTNTKTEARAHVRNGWSDDNICATDDIAQPVHGIKGDAKRRGGYAHKVSIGHRNQSHSRDQSLNRDIPLFATGPNQSKLRPETMLKMETPMRPRKRVLYRRYVGPDEVGASMVLRSDEKTRERASHLMY